MTHSYYFNYTILWASFLTEKGYEFTCGDADIIVLKLPLANDDRFIRVVLEYAEWLKEAKHDLVSNKRTSENW